MFVVEKQEAKRQTSDAPSGIFGRLFIGALELCPQISNLHYWQRHKQLDCYFVLKDNRTWDRLANMSILSWKFFASEFLNWSSLSSSCFFVKLSLSCCSENDSERYLEKYIITESQSGFWVVSCNCRTCEVLGVRVFEAWYFLLQRLDFLVKFHNLSS